MYEDYAKSIGKSIDALTQAEKVQAVYNGIMDEAAMFTGTAEEMASGYQGQQAGVHRRRLHQPGGLWRQRRGPDPEDRCQQVPGRGRAGRQGQR